jgi:hypothetical protein
VAFVTLAAGLSSAFRFFGDSAFFFSFSAAAAA